MKRGGKRRKNRLLLRIIENLKEIPVREKERKETGFQSLQKQEERKKEE